MPLFSVAVPCAWVGCVSLTCVFVWDQIVVIDDGELRLEEVPEIGDEAYGGDSDEDEEEEVDTVPIGVAVPGSDGEEEGKEEEGGGSPKRRAVVMSPTRCGCPLTP